MALLHNSETTRFPDRKIHRGKNELCNKAFELIHAPKDTRSNNIPTIRDEKDMPILATAIEGGVDVLITGDKDFLVLDIETPRIMTMREFLDEFGI